MLARKCDRCKKLYEDYRIQKEDAGEINGVALLEVDLDDFYNHKRNYDLCKECMEKMIKFIEGNHEWNHWIFNRH